ncbi:MAG: tRNA (guanosine(37)-N1)-methyltransferase TrmD [Fimbriimonadaceae bacterium]
MFRVDFVTLFPELVEQMLSHSIMGRAQRSGLVRFSAIDPRNFAYDRHRKVDDTPYGGGPGMVLAAPPIESALDRLEPDDATPIILLDAAAPLFHQTDAERLSRQERLILVCGHYEGVDERVRIELCTEAYSVGSFVVTGGELPALMLADAVTRLRPGVLGCQGSYEDDSFYAGGLLGFPLYTRPETFRGVAVPEVLRSGDHEAISSWRQEQALERTRKYRPDLVEQSDPQKPGPDRL